MLRLASKPASPRVLATLSAALIAALFLVLLPRTETALAARPNVVLIQVDDMHKKLLRAQIKARGEWEPAMPNVMRRIGGQGVEFSRYYASDPICAPSRATLLSGRSTHNHGMLVNAPPYGYAWWRQSSLYSSNLGTWMQDGGYRTAHVGKFFNGYDSSQEVAPGWDRWVTTAQNAGTPYYGTILNIDGRITKPIGSWRSRDKSNCRIAIPSVPGACTHATDVHTAFALKEIRRLRKSRKPLFMQIDFNAPHEDGRGPAGPEPPARFRHLVKKVKPKSGIGGGRGNELKPYFIRDLQPLTKAMKNDIVSRYAREAVAMRAVDDSVGKILKALRRQDELRDTYLIFLSDNGIFHGEHLISYGKYLPHEPSTLQPLLIRGPGVPRGEKTRALSSNLDIASTVMSMAGLKKSSWVDGRSLMPNAKRPAQKSRYPVLLEGFNGKPLDYPGPFTDGGGTFKPNEAVVTNYTGFVAGRWKYVRYLYGEEELYDVSSDPRELTNLVAEPAYSDILSWSRTLSDELDDCKARSCRPEVKPPGRPPEN